MRAYAPALLSVLAACGGSGATADLGAPLDHGTDLSAAHDAAAALDGATKPIVEYLDLAVFDSAGYCNGIVNDAPTITATSATGAIPDGVGGAIMPGVYDLTAYVSYNGAEPPSGTLQVLRVIDAATFQNVQNLQTGATGPVVEYRQTLGYTTSGNVLEETSSCGRGQGSDVFHYTATAGTLSVYDVTASIASIYTRR